MPRSSEHDKANLPQTKKSAVTAPSQHRRSSPVLQFKSGILAQTSGAAFVLPGNQSSGSSKRLRHYSSGSARDSHPASLLIPLFEGLHKPYLIGYIIKNNANFVNE